MGEMYKDMIIAPKKWFIAKTIKAMKFGLNFSGIYHNPHVTVNTYPIYCTAADNLKKSLSLITNDDVFLILYRRPNKYWIGHMMLRKEGYDYLKTDRDLGLEPVYVQHQPLIKDLDDIYDIVSKYKPTNIKNTLIYTPPPPF